MHDKEYSPLAAEIEKVRKHRQKMKDAEAEQVFRTNCQSTERVRKLKVEAVFVLQLPKVMLLEKKFNFKLIFPNYSALMQDFVV